MTNLTPVHARFSVYKDDLDTKSWMWVDAEIVGEGDQTRVKFHFLDEDVVSDWYEYDDIGIFYDIWACEYVQVKELSYADYMEPRGPSGMVQPE